MHDGGGAVDAEDGDDGDGVGGDAVDDVGNDAEGGDGGGGDVVDEVVVGDDADGGVVRLGGLRVAGLLGVPGPHGSL